MVSASLVKAFRLEASGADGNWTTVYRETNNFQRLVQVPLGGVKAAALRLVPEETWGNSAEAWVSGSSPWQKHR